MCVTAVSKKIEAELRKSQKHIARSEKYMTMWRAQTLDLKMALLVSNYDHIYACFTLDKYPRPAEKSQYEGSMSLHSALSEEIITFEQARDIAIRCHERTISHQQRWVNHYQNRLAYERAMLNENGGVVTRTQEFEPGGQVLSRGEWLTILRVNRVRGGDFSRNARLSLSGLQRHDETHARPYHGLQSPDSGGSQRREESGEAPTDRQLSGGRVPGNDKSRVGEITR